MIVFVVILVVFFVVVLGLAMCAGADVGDRQQGLK